MPKIIENLREDILKEAKRQLEENGYAKTTVRSVASALNIGVGTLYNYFKSKDLLISAFMLDDWHYCTSKMNALDPEDTNAFFRGMLLALGEFVDKYRFLFNDQDASRALSAVFNERHVQLRQLLVRIIEPACKSKMESFKEKTFLPEYLAESILYFSMSDSSPEDQITALGALVKIS